MLRILRTIFISWVSGSHSCVLMENPIARDSDMSGSTQSDTSKHNKENENGNPDDKSDKGSVDESREATPTKDSVKDENGEKNENTEEKEEEEGENEKESSSPKKRSKSKSKQTKKKAATTPAKKASPPTKSSPEPLLDDASLPSGWNRKVVQRQTGRSAGKYDVYIFSPDKKKFRSKTELATHLKRIKSDLKLEDFDFSVRGKSNDTPVAKSPAKRKGTDESAASPPSKKKKSSSPGDTKTKGSSQGKSSKKLLVKLPFPSPKKRILSDYAHQSQSETESVEAESPSKSPKTESKSKDSKKDGKKKPAAKNVKSGKKVKSSSPGKHKKSKGGKK